MEQKKNKRARENDEIESSIRRNNKNAKKREKCGISINKEKNEVEEKGSLKSLGAFDFPWLKDGGAISKSEDYFIYLEDKFMSSLESQDTNFQGAIVDFSEEHGLCETLTEASMAHVSEAMLVENVLQPFENNGLEAEDVDCIWSFLLNKPLLT